MQAATKRSRQKPLAESKLLELHTKLPAHRAVPLLAFGPPSSKLHTLMVRLAPGEGLYFHGRVHLRVLEGCARVFGHHFHASPNYHLLVSPFTSGALPIEAVRPTDDVLRLWSQRSNLQSRLSLKQPRSDALHDAIDKKHGITDKMVRQVLERHRKEEDPSRVWDGETVLLLRTFYQERETDHNEEELEEVGGEDDSAKAQMGLRSIVKEKSSSDPPQSPSWTTLQASPASRFFLFESWEMEERKPLQLRAPSQMDSEGSDGSDEETFATNNQSETALPEPLGVALEAHSNRTESQAKETASSMGKSTNNGAEDHRPSLRIPGFYARFFESITQIEENIMVVPHQWPSLAADLTHADESSPPPRVVITGKKGMGKSTLGQYLLNALLDRYPCVVYLETDLGQPEFTPPGLVSLHIVYSPVFGPAFTHLSNPLKSFFLGDTSVGEVFHPYSNALRKLIDHYRGSSLPDTDFPLSSLPLVVNTHGWLKGSGYEVLRDLILSLAPDTAIHICPSISPSVPIDHNPQDNEFPFPEEIIGHQFRSVHLLQAVSPDRPRMILNPEDHRRLRLDAYFDSWHEGSLVTQVPYRVPWNAIRLAFTTDGDVAPSECLFAFNASLVSLCRDNTDYLSCAPPGQEDLSRGRSVYPSLLLAPPLCAECVGLGIVRTINPVTQEFFVLTPIPMAQLQRVNTLVKGAINLPAKTLLRGGWLNNPYLMTEAISRAGGAKMTGRTNIQRKSHTLRT